MRAAIVLLLLTVALMAEARPLLHMVTVDDGLTATPITIPSEPNEGEEQTAPINSQYSTMPEVSDYIRLTLHAPSYGLIAQIDQAITDWLGPNMTRIENSQTLLVQAPRDSSQRVRFIAALLKLDIQADR